MSLRSLIIAISALLTLSITLLFYVQASRVFGDRFTAIEVMQQKSLEQYVRSVLEGRSYLLRTYAESLSSDSKLGRAVLMAGANASGGRALVKELRSRTSCDLVDLIKVGDTRPMAHPELSSEFADFSNLSKDRGQRIGFIKGEPVLLGYSPIKLFQDTVAFVILGYRLNGLVRGEISAATQTDVTFTEPTKGAVRIRANDEVEATVRVSQSQVSGLTASVRKEVIAIGAGCLVLVVSLTYLLLEVGFLRSFRMVLSQVSLGAAELEKGGIPKAERHRFRVAEVTRLSEAFVQYSQGLAGFQDRVEMKTRTEALGEVTSQVAHDLNRVITALEMKLDLDNRTGLSDATKRGVQALLNRARGITESVSTKLRKQSRAGESTPISAEPFSLELLSVVIDSVVAEKSLLYAARPGVLIQVSSGLESLKCVSRVQPNELKRVLSNLIDNSAEAVGEFGTVSVDLFRHQGEVALSVTDTGCGIPPEVFTRLGTRGFSFGKEGGTGLGLWHAMETMRSWGGEVQISSQRGHGTAITLLFPAVQENELFATELVVPRNATIAVVDDDPEVHELWFQRFRAIAGFQGEIVSFRRAEEFVKACRRGELSLNESIVLCDYDFGEEKWNGSQVLEEVDRPLASYLVTGLHEDRAIRSRCLELGVKLLPKSLIGFVPVRIASALPRSEERAGGA